MSDNTLGNLNRYRNVKEITEYDIDKAGVETTEEVREKRATKIEKVSTHLRSTGC